MNSINTMNSAQKSSKKPIFIVIGIAVLAAVIYFYYLGGNSSSTAIVQSSPEAEAAAGRVLSLLNQIQGLRIDTSVFADPAYQSLQDYTVSIPTDNVGRVNPFAPLPGENTKSSNK